MKEIEQYVGYIQAMRASPEEGLKVLAELSQEGFTPNADRLAVLSTQHPTIHDALFNRSITVTLDTGGTAGHVYIENLPIYNPQSQSMEVGAFGYNPKSGKLNDVFGAGEVASESHRQRQGHPSISQKIPLSQEQWERLGRWVREEKGKNTHYFILAHKNLLSGENTRNCVKFTDMVLKTIGNENGFHGVFPENALEGFKGRAIIFSTLAASKNTLTALCQAEDLPQNTCEKFVDHEIKKREAALQVGKEKYLQNTVQAFFNKAKTLSKENVGFMQRLETVTASFQKQGNVREMKLGGAPGERVQDRKAENQERADKTIRAWSASQDGMSAPSLSIRSVPAANQAYATLMQGAHPRTAMQQDFLTTGFLARSGANAYDAFLQGTRRGLGSTLLTAAQSTFASSTTLRDAHANAYQDFMQGTRAGLGSKR